MPPQASDSPDERREQRQARRRRSGRSKPTRPPDTVPAPIDGKKLNDYEKTSLVLKYLREDKGPAEIAALFKERHGITINRQAAFRLIRRAARSGFIRYVAPRAEVLRSKLDESYGWLKEARVVNTATVDDVAYHGAEMLLRLIKRRSGPGAERCEVHVGFSGGFTMRKLAKQFAELLSEASPPLPQTLVLHSLVAGFDVDNPTTEPNAFGIYLEDSTGIDVEIRYVALYAPPLIQSRQLDELSSLPFIREAVEQASKLDIIVTSASCWCDRHSPLRRYLENDPSRAASEAIEALNQHGCVGDMLWQPLGKDGPIAVSSGMQAFTLMALSTLSGFIHDHEKDVLLVLGPCGACFEPKGAILRCILEQRQQLISHLVVDSRSARELVDYETRGA